MCSEFNRKAINSVITKRKINILQRGYVRRLPPEQVLSLGPPPLGMGKYNVHMSPLCA